MKTVRAERLVARCLATVLLASVSPALAETPEFTSTVRAPVEEARTPPARYVDLRFGASSSTQTVICGQLSFQRFSIEGCGTGAGILHDEPVSEISHYRAHVALGSWRSPVGWLSPRLGVGFAEMQVGADAPGFSFSDVDALGAGTAGPELAAGLQLLHRLGAGFELVADVSVFSAWLPHATRLVRPEQPLQFGILLSAGAGF